MNKTYRYFKTAAAPHSPNAAEVTSVDELPAPTDRTRRSEGGAGAQDISSPATWWRIADCGVLGVWLATVILTIRYHEKWADEAQAWLLARDLDLKTLWLHELRYEGSPGLWHTILWMAQHVFHATYASLGAIGVVCAAAGAALLIFKAPFPRYIRWPLAFTYVMVYQYAVIARPYTLLPFLAFAAAVFFKDLKRPERMTLVLILLANLTFHGTVLAGCLGLTYLIEARRSWHTLERSVRNRYIICIAVMAVMFLFLFVILKPTPDVEQIALKKEFGQLQTVGALIPTQLAKYESVLSGAFLDSWVASLLFLVFVGIWFFLRRQLLVFPLAVAALICLYVMTFGYAHHHGTVFIALIASIWIAWPNAQERLTLNPLQRKAQQVMVGLLLCLCAINIWDAEIAIRHEYAYPYSGAEDAANYLKSVGADRGRIVGFLYGVVGVQAYFDHNILANIPTAYYHHGMPLHGLVFDATEFRKINPDYVIAFSEQPQIMLQEGIPVIRAEGYEMAHISDGYMIYKRGVYVRQVYFILRRTSANAARTQ